jgi:hypothetical protein
MVCDISGSHSDVPEDLSLLGGSDFFDKASHPIELEYSRSCVFFGR